MIGKMSDKCCDADFHSQIAYRRADGVNVESLNGHMASNEKARQFLHDSLDEWLNKRTVGGAEDHFIVYAKWPAVLK